MFIDFAGMIININYIINIYKTNVFNDKIQDKRFEIHIKLYPNNEVAESYRTREKQEARFDEIVAEIK